MAALRRQLMDLSVYSPSELSRGSEKHRSLRILIGWVKLIILQMRKPRLRERNNLGKLKEVNSATTVRPDVSLKFSAWTLLYFKKYLFIWLR